MINSATIHHADGSHTCDINTSTIPLRAFEVEVEQRTDHSRKKSQQHGVWPTLSYRDIMTIHMEGDIFGTSSADYFANRETLVLALFGTPGALDTTNRRVGYLQLNFEGATEDWKCDYTIDAFTAPLAALSPSRSEFALTLIAWNPWFIGASSGNKYFYS